MDQHCAHTDYVNALKASLAEKTHKLVETKVELSFLGQQSEEWKANCDALASLLKQSSDITDEERANFHQKLFEGMAKYKFYSECKQDCEKRFFSVATEHADLMAKKFHLEVKHGITFDLNEEIVNSIPPHLFED